MPPVLLVKIAVPLEYVAPVTYISLVLNPDTLKVPPVLFVNVAVPLE